jgi:lauroyl/myristoyl acyltransferase
MNEYWTYRIASWLSRILPEKLAYWAGLRIADQYYKRNVKGRQAVISNLRQILTARGVTPAEATLDGLARKMFQHFGKYLVDFFRYARLTEKEAKRIVSIEHRDYMDRCLKPGKGAILVTAHIGNWELGGAVLAALGYKVNALVLPQRLDRLNRMFQRQRQRRGMNVIQVGDGRSALGVVRLLRRGEVLALLGDRDFTEKQDPIPFFGRPARIPRGPAWLSVKTGAPILAGFLIRQVDDTFLLKLYPPIFPQPGDTVESVRARLCAILETVIGEYPHQWYIFDDFWSLEPGQDEQKGPLR